MIKITRLSTPSDPIVRLRIEGRVVERTADAVTNACRAARADGKHVLLDLAGVPFVDTHGAHAIASLAETGVTPIGCTAFVRAAIGAQMRPDDEIEDADDDAGLAVRLHRRDPQAVEEIVRRHGGGLLAVARALSANDAAARAAVQAAFLSALSAAETSPPDTRLFPLLRRMVVTAALARLRVPDGESDTALDAHLPRFDATGHFADEVGAVEVPRRTFGDRGGQEAVRRSLDRLPASVRAILLACDCEELDIAEVAVVLGTTTDAVKHRLDRARHALRTLLAAERGTSARAAAS